MNKYEVISQVGEGAYGIVLKCKNRETGEFVAVKKFKESEEDELVRKTSLREVKILRILKAEPYIVHLHEAFRRKGRLYLVFEYAGENLLEYLEQRPNGFSAEDVRKMMFTLLLSVRSCHSNNVVHRDIKPENLMVNGKDMSLRLCDFGFARVVEQPKAMTDYVATRWYRAPELLFGTNEYTSAVDMWACGCIMAELMDGNALFPGESEIDQLYLIQKTCGNYTPQQMATFAANPRFAKYKLGDVRLSHPLETRYSRAPRAAIQLMRQLLVVDPALRVTADDALAHPYFAGLHLPPKVNVGATPQRTPSQPRAEPTPPPPVPPAPSPPSVEQARPHTGSSKSRLSSMRLGTPGLGDANMPSAPPVPGSGINDSRGSYGLPSQVPPQTPPREAMQQPYGTANRLGPQAPPHAHHRGLAHLLGGPSQGGAPSISPSATSTTTVPMRSGSGRPRRGPPSTASTVSDDPSGIGSMNPPSEASHNPYVLQSHGGKDGASGLPRLGGSGHSGASGVPQMQVHVNLSIGGMPVGGGRYSVPYPQNGSGGAGTPSGMDALPPQGGGSQYGGGGHHAPSHRSGTGSGLYSSGGSATPNFGGLYGTSSTATNRRYNF